MDAGPVTHTAMGAQPLTWADAFAYGQATLAITEPWEFRTIVKMSLAYLSEREAGKNPLTIPPNLRGADEEGQT